MSYSKFEQKILNVKTKKMQFAALYIYRIAMLISGVIIMVGISPDMPVNWSRWFVFLGLMGIFFTLSLYERALFGLISKLKSTIDSQQHT